MTKIKRQIIKIDENKCNGCGACVPACKEGALQIIDGKARLVSEVYCDGLGACLGDCPTGALKIEEREVEAFDEDAVEEHLASSGHGSRITGHEDLPCGCPGTMARKIRVKIETEVGKKTNTKSMQSELGQWPIQLTLIPVMAPYLKNADFVLLADCTAVAYANLHRDFIKDRVIALACPKLDDTEPYVEKLAQMMKVNDFNSVEVVMMEVPCCGGLSHVLDRAKELAGVDVKIKKTIITIEGERREL
jgi:NAD-dependent dihydropyrimidine dehydrogenase PreA subunit